MYSGPLWNQCSWPSLAPMQHPPPPPPPPHTNSGVQWVPCYAHDVCALFRLAQISILTVRPPSIRPTVHPSLHPAIPPSIHASSQSVICPTISLQPAIRFCGSFPAIRPSIHPAICMLVHPNHSGDSGQYTAIL